MINAMELACTSLQPPSRRWTSALAVHHDKYLRRTVTSPYNLLAPIGFALCVLLTGAWSPALVGLALHLTALLVVPRRAWFRAQIDRADEQAEQAELAATRAQLLQRMSDAHRRTFEYLEALARRIGEHIGGVGTGCMAADCFGLPALLSSYLRLAIAHREAEQHLSITTRQTLVTEIGELRTSASYGSSHMRQIRTQRLAIAEKRLDRWDQTSDQLACMKSQMATIDSLLHLAYESSVVPVSLEQTTSAVSLAIAEFVEEHAALRELTAMALEENIDPRIFHTQCSPPVQPSDEPTIEGAPEAIGTPVDSRFAG